MLTISHDNRLTIKNQNFYCQPVPFYKHLKDIIACSNHTIHIESSFLK